MLQICDVVICVEEEGGELLMLDVACNTGRNIVATWESASCWMLHATKVAVPIKKRATKHHKDNQVKKQKTNEFKMFLHCISHGHKININKKHTLDLVRTTTNLIFLIQQKMQNSLNNHRWFNK
jgi:hypothetical protein